MPKYNIKQPKHINMTTYLWAPNHSGATYTGPCIIKAPNEQTAYKIAINKIITTGELTNYSSCLDTYLERIWFKTNASRSGLQAWLEKTKKDIPLLKAHLHEFLEDFGEMISLPLADLEIINSFPDWW